MNVVNGVRLLHIDFAVHDSFVVTRPTTVRIKCNIALFEILLQISIDDFIVIYIF
jgi:hypothetical protein